IRHIRNHAPHVRARAEHQPQRLPPEVRSMTTHIAIVAFDNMAALDAIGPFEVLAHLPDAQMHWVGLETGVVRTEENSGVGINVDELLEDVPAPDIVVVPGGHGE